MFESPNALVVGSGSPRRKEMLEQAGLSVLVLPQDVDETQRFEEDAEGYVRRVTNAKMKATLLDVQRRQLSHVGVLCADTIVCVDGIVLQKPRDVDDAAKMFGLLVGRSHLVMTSYAISCSKTGRTIERTVRSLVTFRSAEPAEIVAYAKCHEGFDKAGAYAIQGRGAIFVERLDGSYSNVVGLPLCEVFMDLKRLGIVSLSGEVE